MCSTFDFNPHTIDKLTGWSTFLQMILQVASCFERLIAVVACHSGLYVSCLDMVDHGGFALGMGDLLAGTTLQF